MMAFRLVPRVGVQIRDDVPCCRSAGPRPTDAIPLLIENVAAQKQAIRADETMRQLADLGSVLPASGAERAARCERRRRDHHKAALAQCVFAHGDGESVLSFELTDGQPAADAPVGREILTQQCDPLALTVADKLR